jgi:predicted amidohydrolase YtcJ
MTNTLRVCLVIVALALPGAAAQQHADLVLRNGAVYTVDAARSWASVVAIAKGRIVYVGDDRGAARWIGARTRVVDLRGELVLPGFHDAHTHPVTSGIELGECTLNDAASAEAVLDAVKAYAAANPTKSWIRGGGWQLPLFPGGNPHKSLLDRAVPDRPVFLVAADGHSAWASSRALQLAGITAKTPDPPNGRIERDAATGEPTGTLRESAVELVARLLPAYTARDHVDGLRRALEMAGRLGVTSMYEASASDEKILAAYRDLDRRGALTARVVAAVTANPAGGIAQVARMKALRTTYQSAHLRTTAAKIFADGVIEAHTAALVAPYTDTPGEAGRPNFSPEALAELVTALDRDGFQVHVHAIGDGATRMALDAFERARERNGARDSRHQIAHLELVAPEDLPRFRRLGVVANFQPLWAYADTYITELTEPVLGPERASRLYQIHSMMRTGAVVAAGSDWSVTSMDPLEAIQVAVTRRALDKTEGPSWLPDERVDVAAMVAAYTIGGAWAMFQERETGSIEVGKAADIVVLDRNIFEIPAHEIHDAKVALTLFEGREIYKKD